jgi:AraC-like DNA-binding protein
VLRFRRFVSWADAGAPDDGLASAAARLGYADQAHLTRECARLAGLTPTALLAARRRPALAVAQIPAPARVAGFETTSYRVAAQ